MADLPRRLPPSDAERLRIVVTRTAGGGDLGSTRWAQPVTKTSNYSPVNAAPDVPAYDPGIYTVGAYVSTTLVSNDTGDPAQDQNYDLIVGTVGGAALDGGENVLKPGRAYLVEVLATASMGIGEAPANALDGLQVFVRLDLDNTETPLTLDATNPPTTVGWIDSPADVSSRPVLPVPATTDGQGPNDPALARSTFRLTSVIEFPATYGGTPAITFVVRSSGPSSKLIHGGAFLRVSYLYDVASPV